MADVVPDSGSPQEDSTLAKSAPRPRRRGRHILWTLPVLAVILFLIDRSLRPPPPNTQGVNITTGADGSPVVKDSVTDLFNQPRPANEHALQQSLDVAEAGLNFYRQNVRDYQAVFIKQERVGGRLDREERALVKFRQGRVEDGKNIPQAIYMRFVEPKSIAGREVIYVEGRNDGKLVAHEGGLLNVVRANLLPTSRLAMRGNRYPITEFGIEKLIVRMIEKGTRDLQFGECQVEIKRNIEINGHSGTEIRIIHPQPAEHFDFHIARILIDDELNLPVGYEGYTWPEPGSDAPVLNERYFYTEVKLNVGLKDSDFDPDNPEYDFP